MTTPHAPPTSPDGGYVPPAARPPAPHLPPTRRGGLLARLGLGTRELRAWAYYDVANSAIFTILVTAVFPAYYAKVAAKGLVGTTATTRYSLATTAALLLAVLISPVLGALGDARPIKKRIIGICVGVGALATAALGLVGPGGWMLALVAFGVVNVAVNGSTVLYDALLPHLAPPEDLDRASSAGYALGYLGGGLLLAAGLAVILKPELAGLGALAARDGTIPTRLVFVATALWWAGFTIPLLRRVPEPPTAAGAAPNGRAPSSATAPGVVATVRGAFVSLAGTVRTLRAMPEAWRYLWAFVLYNDAINTIIRMATVYGAELRLSEASMIGAILLVQFLGIPFAFLFGAIAARIGARRAILGALAVYAVVTAVAYRLQTERDFWILAVLVAMVQGGAQALSRSLYASLVPASRSGEFFGLFSVFARFGGMLGPLTMAGVTALTGSSRLGIVSVLAFFIVGGVQLARVNVEAGRARAQRMDAEDARAAA